MCVVDRSALAAGGACSTHELGATSAIWRSGWSHGASLQPFIADPRCRRIVSIDRRDVASPDVRAEGARYLQNTTIEMLKRLERVPGADLGKLTTIDATTEDVDPAEVSGDLCLIDAQHTNAAALQDARFCRKVIRDRGVIVFHDRVLVDRGIRQFLGELPRSRAYPLAHDLLVVEINVPSLLDDPRVRAQLPGDFWLVVDRLHAVRLVLGLAPMVRALRRGFAPA